MSRAQELAPGVLDIRGKVYETVAKRVSDFRDDHPATLGWSIETEIVDRTEEECVMRTTIRDHQGRLVATGTAHETKAGLIRGDMDLSRSLVEVCETSSVGRALAFAGYLGHSVASADEISKAMQPLNEKQIADVEKWIAEAGADRSKFLEAMGYKDVKEIPATSYSLIRVALKAKKETTK